MTGITSGVPGLCWRESGLAILGDELLDRFEATDRVFAGWAAELGAVRRFYPDLIELSQLNPVRYLQSFPHHATLVTGFRPQPAVFARAGGEYADAATIAVDESMQAGFTHLLAPAACYHCYPEFAGRQIERTHLVTMRCTCHRREQAYEPLRRQWCFRMREIVCLGDAKSVATFAEDARQWLDRLIVELGLEARWATAMDPFFDCENDPKALAQRVAPSKQELRLADGLAIASVNEHRTFFGDAYGIRTCSGAAWSACVAFGLERWLWAFLDRFGPRVSTWPALPCPKAIS